jgi:hypothetical protein
MKNGVRVANCIDKPEEDAGAFSVGKNGELRQSNVRIQKPVQRFRASGQVIQIAFQHFRKAIEQCPERSAVEFLVSRGLRQLL